MIYWTPTSFFFLCFFHVLFATAQIEISGTVKDTNNQAIESANVILYDLENNIIDYSYTNKNGVYIINLKPYLNTLFKVSAQSLGFQTKSDTLNLILNKKKYTLSFNLKEKTEQLKEVVLKPDEKITREGRVTTIKVSAFKNDIEQTVEDILKSLPGIEVLKNGAIKAHGRYIDKLLIEGEDMFDKNYTMLSKNLDAKVLDAIQILDGFEDNPILAKAIESDKVALNLLLKENYKNIWFGNVSTGLGTENRIELASNIGLIKKNIKFFNFNNYNNLGKKASEQLEGAPSSMSTNGSFREEKIEFDIEPIYDIQNNDIPFFNEGQGTFNKAFIDALSFVTSLNSNLKIRGTGYFINDNQNQFFSSETTFNTGETPIFYSEYSNTKRKNSIAGGELELKYTLGEKSYLKNVFIYNSKPEKTVNHSLFNNYNIDQDLNQKESVVYNHLNYSYLIGEKKILHTYLYFGKDRVTQDLILKNPELSNILTPQENSLIANISNDKVSVYGGKSTMLLNFNQVKTTIELGYESLREYRENEFYVLEANTSNEVDSLENNMAFKQNKIQINTNINYNISKNLELSAGLGIDHLNINTEISERKKWLLNPKIRLHIKNLKLGYFSLGYIKNYNAPVSNVFLNNFQINSYQSFVKGTKEIFIPQNNTFRFYFEKYNQMKTQSISIRILYRKANGNYSTENFIGQNIILTSYGLVDFSDMTTTNINFTSYFKKLALSTNLGTSQNWVHSPIKANTPEFKDLNMYNASYFISGRTYFKLPVNFSFKFNFNQTESNFNNITNKTHWSQLDLNATYKITDELISSFKSNLYLMEDSNYYFLNFRLDFNPKKSKLSYILTLNNMTNEYVFSITNIDDYSIYKSTVELLPRYLFAVVKYRF